MAPRLEAHVKPAVLRWARETAAYDVEGAARRVSVRPERLMEWESGDRLPTLAQLRKLAEVYKRPFAAFFRSEPPETPFVAPTDFRRTAESLGVGLTPELSRELRRARFRQRVAIDLAEELGDEVRPFTLSTTRETPILASAQRLRAYIAVSVNEQRGWQPGRESFNNWRTAFESASILVFQSTLVSLDQVRGFSVFAERFPVIGVNRKDAYAGRVFSLFHELAHLSLREAGICDLDGVSPVEMYCNAVAAEALLPKAFVDDRFIQPTVPSDDEVQRFADSFGVSAEVVWRRLLDAGRVTGLVYEQKRRELAARFTALAAARREQDRARGRQGGPPPAKEVLSLNGRPYTNLVLSALGQGVITSADAAEFMGIRAKHFERVSAEASSSSVAS